MLGVITRERLTHHRKDRGALLVESVLRDEQIVHALIISEKEKAIIVRQIVFELTRLNSFEQAGFLRTLFENMAIEGDAKVTNRRDACLAILTNTANNDVRLTEAMIPFVKANPIVIYEAYIEAVQKQTRDNDPFSGSIDTLLQAGKAIAPYLSQLKGAKRTIVREWDKVVEEFSTLDKRIHMRFQIEDIRFKMSPTW